MSRPSSFDDAMLRRMQAMWADGARLADIAADLHRPMSTVSNMIMTLRKRGWSFERRQAEHSAERDRQIAALWKAGRTAGEIAEAVGCPHGTVSTIVRRLHLARRGSGKPSHKEDVLRLWAAGRTRSEIASDLNIVVGTVSQILAKARQEGDRRARYYAPANARKAAAAEASSHA